MTRVAGDSLRANASDTRDLDDLDDLGEPCEGSGVRDHEGCSVPRCRSEDGRAAIPTALPAGMDHVDQHQPGR